MAFEIAGGKPDIMLFHTRCFPDEGILGTILDNG